MGVKPAYSFILAVVVGVALLGATTPARAQGALDGRAFSVVSTNPEEPYPDHLVFQDGNFESMGCRPFGFTAEPYTTTEENGVTTFAANTESPTEGAMAWTGQVAADGTISGSFTWTKEGQDPLTASWAGAAASGPLDGRAFTVTETGGDGTTDRLTFMVGAFESEGCREYGFWPVAYQATANADGTTAYTSTSYSFAEGMMAWSGTINGDNIEGSYTWTKEGQVPVTAAFTGTAEAAAAPAE